MSAVIVGRSPAIITVKLVPGRAANTPGVAAQTVRFEMHEQSSASYAHGAEEWRAIPGYEGRYEVSNLGRVRTLHDRWGRQRELTPDVTSKGYLRVRLAGLLPSVHRLVLEAFVGPCPAGHEGAHVNGQRGDNRLVNLAWKTKTENEQDKRAHGTVAVSDRNGSRLHPERLARGDRNGSRLSTEQLERGERTSGAKVSAEQVREIRAASLGGEKTAALCARYGLTQSTVRRIVRRQTWAALTNQQPTTQRAAAAQIREAGVLPPRAPLTTPDEEPTDARA